MWVIMTVFHGLKAHSVHYTYYGVIYCSMDRKVSSCMATKSNLYHAGCNQICNCTDAPLMLQTKCMTGKFSDTSSCKCWVTLIGSHKELLCVTSPPLLAPYGHLI